MRKYLDIDLGTLTVSETPRSGDDLVNTGRYFIARVGKKKYHLFDIQ